MLPVCSVRSKGFSIRVTNAIYEQRLLAEYGSKGKDLAQFAEDGDHQVIRGLHGAAPTEATAHVPDRNRNPRIIPTICAPADGGAFISPS